MQEWVKLRETAIINNTGNSQIHKYLDIELLFVSLSLCSRTLDFKSNSHGQLADLKKHKSIELTVEELQFLYTHTHTHF